MDKHSGDGTYRIQTRHGDTRRLQLALAGTVCLFVCSLLMNVLVYVRLTAAITDLSRRLEEVEGRQDSHRSSVYPDRLASNAPDVVTAKGQGSMQGTADNQSLTHFALRSRQSGPMRKRSARTICHSNEYECQNGDCIYSRWQCDGDNDCTDDSDEYPLNEKCIPLYSTYRCRNGKAIPSKFQCDGGNDCRDGSDEYPLNEECHPAYWCKNGRQIPSNWQCDGDDDCHDSSDEYPLNEECHLCKNGREIPSKWQCDGDNDCHDGSDEYPLNEECNPCETHQCQNNATCKATEDGYTCICTEGWCGEYCQHKIDPCETHQCQNNATCHTTEDGYICNCTDDWRGEYCQHKIDPCESHQCQNSATCRANKDGYKCSCTKGWRGKYCQRKRVRQEQRGMRQERNYGLGTLLSVHIQARTDTTESAGAIPVTGNFTQWEDITETRFGLQNGQLEIKESGKYFIYGQVFFDKDEKDEKARYSIKKGGEVKLTCEAPLIGFPPHLTCYTAGVLDLQRGDILVLYVYGKDSWIITAEDATFWGAIKLSIGLPKEDRPRKRGPKKGKS
ncbi:low-density lipoprotein receptor-related protein-like [Branchiostoma floridae]|uniref:Low-density lipoprotein receptor-related protein-like n=1 Tax=Branchiostoma floridae TaxID=7739 RepID=A0A9J7HJW8_BRAFL|nr:low-density lipoprotein receptor-related protein-like [Branchiostoma floridae]